MSASESKTLAVAARPPDAKRLLAHAKSNRRAALRSAVALPVLAAAGLAVLVLAGNVALGELSPAEQDRRAAGNGAAEEASGLRVPPTLTVAPPADSFYDRISSRRLFDPVSKRPKKPEREAPVEPAPPRPIDDGPPPPPPEPKSSLVLTGIIGEGESLAVIFEDRESKKAYMLTGGAVLGGETLSVVLLDGVRLRKGGQERHVAPGTAISVPTKSLPAPAGEITTAANKPKNAVVEKYDKDADGKVTAEEYPGSPAMFKRLDKNGDGVVSDDDL